MPVPGGFSEWPSVAERRARCVVQYATPVTDTLGGRREPTWTDFGNIWDCKVTVVPFIVNETQSTMLYQVEGPYRQDMMTKFTTGIGLRVVTSELTLKVFQLEHPQLRRRILIAHCAPAVNTQ